MNFVSYGSLNATTNPTMQIIHLHRTYFTAVIILRYWVWYEFVNVCALDYRERGREIQSKKWIQGREGSLWGKVTWSNPTEMWREVWRRENGKINRETKEYYVFCTGEIVSNSASVENNLCIRCTSFHFYHNSFFLSISNM